MPKKRGRPRKNTITESPVKIIKKEDENEKEIKLFGVFPCDYCNRFFKTKLGTKIHMATCMSQNKVIKEEIEDITSETETEEDEGLNNNVENEAKILFINEFDTTDGNNETLHISDEFTNTIEINEFQQNNANGENIIITEFISVANNTENIENENANDVVNLNDMVIENGIIFNENEPQYAELQPVELSHVEEYVILPPDDNSELKLNTNKNTIKIIENIKLNTENHDPLDTQPTVRSYSSIYELMRKEEANKPQDIYDFIDEDDPHDEAKLAREKLERTCEICDAEFEDPIELLRHRRDRHKRQKISLPISEIEQYFDHPNREFCPLCHRAIKTKGFKSVFMKHLLVHTEEIKFECNICNAKFRRKDHMKNHKRRHVV